MARKSLLEEKDLVIPMTRRNFLRLAGGSAALLTLGGPLSALESLGGSGKKPNIVVIVADDLGYGELGIQGSKDIPTPHIDSIARNGVRFTNGYVSCPVCSPTRAGLMTGRYQQRFGHELNPGPAASASGDFGLPKTETTLAERMKALGYTTGMFGKWHLGYKPEQAPPKRGFDEFYGFLGGAHDYLDAKKEKLNPIMDGMNPVASVDYTTDAFSRRAVSFIEKHKGEPFFLYLPYNAVHSPLESVEKYLKRFQGIKDDKRRTFAAMLTAMDEGVGQVLAKLRELSLEENTLVFFVSDNGGPTKQTTSANAPLRGFKGQVLEGGIRVPFMVQWKGHIPAAKVYEQPVISLDILPTVIAAAGGNVGPEAKVDGVNLLPYLTGKSSTAPHDRLYWRFGSRWAIRQGDWKLLDDGDGMPELYNLAKDIGEKEDLAQKEPDRLKELKTAYDAWNAQLMAPRWIRQAAGKPKRRGKRAKKRNL